MYWAKDIEEVYRELVTSPTGLTEEEAERRLKSTGPNTITERPRLTKTKIVINQLRSPLIFILIVAGVVTAILGEWIDTGVIFASVLVNTALGFWQEHKAETVFELLKSYIRTHARVRRDGGERFIDATGLVPGDMVRISQGDRVPADARLIFVNSLEVDESILTGESLPVKKSMATVPEGTSLGDRTPMVWNGTLVTGGFADAVVSATGNVTEFGKIAASVATKDTAKTPLQAAIGRFAIITGVLVGILTLALFSVGLLLGQDLFEMFLIAVSIAVSAVPEGLPVALTVILAVGAQRIAAKRGVVRKLLAAETLGSTSIILTDKTGTLTQARMELRRVIPFSGDKTQDIERLLMISLPNTDVVIENPEDSPEKWRTFGRALEAALVMGAGREGILLPSVMDTLTVLGKLPFDSEQKFSATLVKEGQGVLRLAFLGAPEILLAHTTLSRKEQQTIAQEIADIASQGRRVLGVASKKMKESNEALLSDLKTGLADLTWEGLIVFHDPIRPNIVETVRRVSSAGIRTIIVTGDHEGTARAIARDAGLIDGGGEVMRGEELSALSKEELERRKGHVRVYARVTPEQKVMLAHLYKEEGEVVAMIGDGVNDAPALQAADIGVAVGSGTDVAKSASDLVILDDDFRTLTTAIEEGRRILGNIRKVIVYLLSSILDELFLIGGALLMGLPLPLSALQILFVNFFSDSFPAISLAFEKGIDQMGKKPQRIHKNLLDREMRFLIIVIGGISSLSLFILYALLLALDIPLPLAQSFIFTSFATYTLFVAFSVRSLKKSIFTYNPFSNPYLVGGVIIGLLLTASVLFLPALRTIFGIVPLPWPWLLGAIGVGIINILAIEFGKWVYREQK